MRDQQQGRSVRHAPLSRRRGSRPVAGRRAFKLQQLEQRILLAADPPATITPEESAALIESLDQLDVLGDRLDQAHTLRFDLAAQTDTAAATIEALVEAPLEVEYGFDATILTLPVGGGDYQTFIQFGDSENNYVRGQVQHAIGETLTGQVGFFQFESAGRSDTFQQAIPLTGGRTLADVLDLSAAIGAKLIAPLGVTTGTTGDGGSDPAGTRNSEPGFRSVQELGNRLASAVHYVADLDGDLATYDPAITFAVDFHHLFDVASFDLDYDFDVDDLNGVQSDSTIDVEADLNAGQDVDLAAGTLDVTLQCGRLLQVDFSDLPASATLGDLIDRFGLLADAAVGQFAFDELTEQAQAVIADDPVLGLIPEYLFDASGVGAGSVRLVISEAGDALEILDSSRVEVFGGNLIPLATSVAPSGVAASLGLSGGRAADGLRSIGRRHCSRSTAAAGSPTWRRPMKGRQPILRRRWPAGRPST